MPSNFIKSTIATAFGSYKNRISQKDQKWLFLIGHMRSGSSLLLHLLINHPDLLGHGESNSTYNQTNNLHILELKSRWTHHSFFKNYEYFVDQINHNQFTPNFHLLNQAPVSFIFLIREPFATVSSLLRLSEQFYKNKWTVSMAIDYYCERMKGMAKLYQAIDNQSQISAVRYEHLISHPERALKNIQVNLNLQTAFSTTYDIYKFTGKKGDPGTSIKEKKIVKKEKPLLDFTPEQINKLEENYNSCIKLMNL